MIDSIANLFLSLTRDQFIIPVIVLGYIWLDRETFYHATCLILISMIFNTALKVTFQIPLSPLLGKEGFAFPSGHMQSSATFFGWLAFRSKSLAIRLAFLALIIGIGLSLLHFQYHNYYDVLGAVFFALLLIVVYYQIIKRQRVSWLIVMFTSTILVVYIHLKFALIADHVWLAYYALIGFICSERIFVQTKLTLKVGEKIVNTVICFGSIAGIIYIFSNKIFAPMPLYITNLQWLIIGFIVPAVSKISWFSKHSRAALPK